MPECTLFCSLLVLLASALADKGALYTVIFYTCGKPYSRLKRYVKIIYIYILCYLKIFPTLKHGT